MVWAILAVLRAIHADKGPSVLQLDCFTPEAEIYRQGLCEDENLDRTVTAGLDIPVYLTPFVAKEALAAVIKARNSLHHTKALPAAWITGLIPSIVLHHRSTAVLSGDLTPVSRPWV